MYFLSDFYDNASDTEWASKEAFWKHKCIFKMISAFFNGGVHESASYKFMTSKWNIKMYVYIEELTTQCCCCSFSQFAYIFDRYFSCFRFRRRWQPNSQIIMSDKSYTNNKTRVRTAA